MLFYAIIIKNKHLYKINTRKREWTYSLNKNNNNIVVYTILWNNTRIKFLIKFNYIKFIFIVLFFKLLVWIHSWVYDRYSTTLCLITQVRGYIIWILKNISFTFVLPFKLVKTPWQYSCGSINPTDDFIALTDDSITS